MRDYGTNHLGLYQMLVDTCVSYLDEMCLEATSIPEEKLLEHYVNTWERYQTVIKRCSILLLIILFHHFHSFISLTLIIPIIHSLIYKIFVFY